MQPDQPPPAQPRGSIALTVLQVAVAIVCWFVAAWLTFISIPRGARLFAEFHMAIPMITELVVRFGQIAVPILAITSFLVCLKVRRRWAWLWFILVLPTFIATAVFVSLYLPITKLLVAMWGSTDGWWTYF